MCLFILYSQVMKSEFAIYSLEASLKDFKDTGIIKNIPEVEKDALYIYHVLKEDARAFGHTYVPMDELKNHCMWTWRNAECNDHQVTHWQVAIFSLSLSLSLS